MLLLVPVVLCLSRTTAESVLIYVYFLDRKMYRGKYGSGFKAHQLSSCFEESAKVVVCKNFVWRGE